MNNRAFYKFLQASIKHANEGCYNAADECLQQVTSTKTHFWRLPVTITLSKAHLCLAPTMQVLTTLTELKELTSEEVKN